MNFIILFKFFLLFNLSAQQSCCSAVSCPFDYKCLCSGDPETPACLGKISNSPKTFTINRDIRGFFYVPSESQFSEIKISTCVIRGGSFGFLIVSVINQNINGTVANSNLQYYSTSLLSRCSILKLTDRKFANKSNGQLSNLILYINTNTNQDVSLSIIVQTSQAQKQNIIIPIMIGVSIFVLIILISLSVWCIYRRFRIHVANQSPAIIVVPQNAHIQVYMPALTLKQIKNRYLYQEQITNCTVCLIDINNDNSVRRSPCTHIFHQQCIDQWCKKNLNCPLCRYPLDKQSLKKQIDCTVSLDTQNKTSIVMVHR